MTHYVVVQLAPKDQETLDQYLEVGGAAVKKHGGYPIAGGSEKKVIEENGGGVPAHVLLAFPDAESVTAWIEDPELEATHALRRAGAVTTMTMLPPM